MDERKRREFIQACNGRLLTELSPVTDGDLYVDLDAAPARSAEAISARTGIRGTWPGRSAIDELAEVVATSTDATTQVFAGFLGCGKTTELKRLAGKLDERGVKHHIVWVKLHRHVPMGQVLHADDFLRAAAFELEHAAAGAPDAANVPRVQKPYAIALWDLLADGKLDFEDMGLKRQPDLGENIENLRDTFEKNSTFRERAHEIVEKRFRHFVNTTQEAIQDAVVRIKKGTGAERVVVLVDDLEKLTSAASMENLDAVQASVDRVFSVQSSYLKLPSCHTIHVVPFWLLCRNPKLGVDFDGPPVILSNVKVDDHRGEQVKVSLDGIERLEEVVRLRAKRAGIQDLTEVFGPDLPETLHPLIHLSGGNLRQLLVFVRDLLHHARSWPVKVADTRYVCSQVIEHYNLTLRIRDIDVLLDVDRTKQVPGSNEDLVVFSQHQVRLLILAYKNQSYWYDVHPAVRECRAYKAERARRERQALAPKAPHGSAG